MDNKQALPINKQLRGLANEMRKNATKEENHLWYDYLKNYPLKFHRQRIIGNFIVDFYCPKAMLVVELDGSQHYENDLLQQDEERTKYLHTLGYTVLRLSNFDIKDNFEGCCQYIEMQINIRMQQGYKESPVTLRVPPPFERGQGTDER